MTKHISIFKNEVVQGALVYCSSSVICPVCKSQVKPKTLHACSAGVKQR